MLEELSSWWKALSSLINGESRTPKKKYSADTLWTPLEYSYIKKLKQYAGILEDKYLPSRIYEAASSYLEAANYALAFTAKVPDAEARDFLLRDKIIPLYSNASANFWKFISKEEYKNSPDLNLTAYKICLETQVRYAALHLLVGDESWYGFDVKFITEINEVIRKKYTAQETSQLYMEVANKVAKAGLPERLLLQLYSVCLENLAPSFYEDKCPSDITIDIYRIAMEESVAASANLDPKLFEIKYQEMQKMLGRLDEVRSDKYNGHEINIDSKDSNKQEHPTLRHRKPLKLHM